MHQLSLTLLILSTSIMAQLPPEINYPQHERAYNAAALSVEESKSRVLITQDELEAIKTSIKLNQQEEFNIQRDLSDRNFELTALEQKIPSSEQRLNQISQEIELTRQKRDKQTQRVDRLTQKIRNLRSQISPQKQQIERLSKEIDVLRNHKKDKNSQIESLTAKQQKLTATIQMAKKAESEHKKEFDKLTNQKQNMGSKISSLESSLPQLEARLKKLSDNLNAKNKQIIPVRESLKKARAKLKQLKDDGASAGEIQAAKNKVEDAKKNLGYITEKIEKLKVDVPTKKKEVAITKKQIQNLKDKRSKIPSLLQQANAKKQQQAKLVVESQKQKQQNKRTIENTKVSIAQFSSKIQNKQQKLASLNQQIQGKRQEIQSKKTTRDEVATRLERNRRRLNVLNEQNSEERKNYARMIKRLPILESNIDRLNRELFQRQTETASLEKDKRAKIYQIELQQQELHRLETVAQDAYKTYEDARNLYASYESSANKKGSSQTGNAFTLGAPFGEKQATLNAKRLGDSSGVQLGANRGALIALVRAENESYPKGYDAGVVSESTRAQAVKEATRDGIAKANSYAATVLKPQFFEEYIQKTFSNNTQLNFKNFSLFEFEAVKFNLPQLSLMELESSREYITSLDIKIEASNSRDTYLIEQYSAHKNPENSFAAPTSIPYATPNCSGVYKELQVFVNMCKKSYKNAFKSKYISGAATQYTQVFPPIFDQAFELSSSKAYEQAYSREHTAALNIAFKAGEEAGKKVLYNTTYSEYLDRAYEQEIPTATQIAKDTAQIELKDFLKSSPLLHASSIKLSGSIIAGSQGEVLITIKNVGYKRSVTGSIQLTGVHLTLGTTTLSIPPIAPQSSTTLSVPYSISDLAGSDKELAVIAHFSLPGDKYKASRSEQLSFTKRLAINTRTTGRVSFTKRPDIRKFKKYYVHTMKVSLSPKAQNLPKGMLVKMVPLNGASKYVTFKVNNVKTASMSKNKVTYVDLKYKFSKNAKNRDLAFIVKATYEGKTVFDERVSIRPH